MSKGGRRRFSGDLMRRGEWTGNLYRNYRLGLVYDLFSLLFCCLNSICGHANDEQMARTKRRRFNLSYILNEVSAAYRHSDTAVPFNTIAFRIFHVDNNTTVRPCILATTTLKTTRNVVYCCISDQINRSTAIMPSLDSWVPSLSVSPVVSFSLSAHSATLSSAFIKANRANARDNEGSDPLLISVLNAETLSNKLLSKYLRTGRIIRVFCVYPGGEKTPTRIEI